MSPLLEFVLLQIPTIINAIKNQHTQVNPDLPPLTDTEALSILWQAVNSSIAKDDDWLSAHPV